MRETQKSSNGKLTSDALCTLHITEENWHKNELHKQTEKGETGRAESLVADEAWKFTRSNLLHALTERSFHSSPFLARGGEGGRGRGGGREGWGLISASAIPHGPHACTKSKQLGTEIS